MPARRNSLRERIGITANRAQTATGDARVNRVLNLLSEPNLTTAAVEQCGTSGSLTIESVDIPHVWENERVRARVAELERQGIGVESRQIGKTVAGMTFHCWVLCVRY